jgi:histidinol-phosphate aminotransferase
VIRSRPALEAIPTYVPGRSAESVAAELGIDSVVKLASNEAPFGPLPAARAAIADAVAGVNRYPDDRSAALTERLAETYDVDASQVLVGAGSVDLCRIAVAATVDPGDEIVFAWPSFEMYPILAQQAGGTAVRVPLVGAAHDLDAMAEAATDRARLVFVCNPNNPTSTAVGRRDLQAFLSGIRPDCLVVLDEAYREFATAPDFPDGLDMLAAHDNVVVLRTFSKAYGLAALRVGYAIGEPGVIAVLRKVAMPFRVNGLAQVAALASLGTDAQSEMRARVDDVVSERDRVTRELRELGLEIPRSEANFVWLDLPDAATELGRLSEQHGVVLRVFPGVGVRVTIGTAVENDRFLGVMREFVDREGITAAPRRTD